MPIFSCSMAHVDGYNPNGGNSKEATELHNEMCHTETYAGCVLGTYERNGYDDSDFFAIVWDETTKSVRAVAYASTAYWSYHNSAKVDAEPEVIADAEAWMVETLTQLAISSWDHIMIGKTVRSLTKKGKYVGVEGIVLRVEMASYRQPYSSVTIEVTNSSEFHYSANLSYDRVEVVGEPDKVAIRRQARLTVQSHGICGAYRGMGNVR